MNEGTNKINRKKIKKIQVLGRTTRIHKSLAGLIKFEREKVKLFNIINQQHKWEYGNIIMIITTNIEEKNYQKR